MVKTRWPHCTLGQQSGGRGLPQWLHRYYYRLDHSGGQNNICFSKGYFVQWMLVIVSTQAFWELPASGICPWLGPKESQSNADSWRVFTAEPQVRYPRSSRKISPLPKMVSTSPTPENSKELESPLCTSQELRRWNLLPPPHRGNSIHPAHPTGSSEVLHINCFLRLLLCNLCRV